MGRSGLVLGLAAALALLMGGVARAQPASAEAAIAARLAAWTRAFNARDLSATCNLFTPDLAYSFLPDVVNGTRGTLCANLARQFARTDIAFHYAPPEIREIIVSGDMAIVRLAWTLTVARAGARETRVEEGLDVFRRQPDGTWSIIRYIAASVPARGARP